MGSMMTFDGAEMNEPPMPSGADVDEIVVAVTVKREVAAVSYTHLTLPTILLV